MKSIAFLSFFVFLAGAAAPLWGQKTESAPAPSSETKPEKTHALVLRVEGGVMDSTSFEIIYEAANSKRVLSELTWNLKPLWLAGISAEYAPRNPLKRRGYYGKLSFSVGFPVTVGVIEDRDWLLPSQIPGVLTHFSSHENRMAFAALFAETQGGISLPLTRRLMLRPFIGLSYMYFKYEAWNGYLQYPSTPHYPHGEPMQPYPEWTSNIPKEPFTDGKGITYLQHWLILTPGVELAAIVSRFSFSFSLSLSPLNFCYSADTHHARNPPFKYTSLIFGGFYFEPKGNIAFRITDHLSLGGSVSFRLIRGSRGFLTGEMYEASGTTKTSYGYATGAAYQSLYGQAFLRFSF
jgi:outer membrane protease